MKVLVFLTLLGCSVAVSKAAAFQKINALRALANKNDGDEMATSSLMVSSGKIFGYGRQKAQGKRGQVVAKVSKEPKMIDLSPEDQQRKWFDLADNKFPLKAGGFAQWRPTRNGLIFRTEDEKSSMVCVANKHSGDNSSAVFRFNCDPATQTSPRFAKSRYYYYWTPVTDGCPYGWSGYWDDWTYAYWAQGPRGYYGCNTLVAQDWCPSDYPNCACGGKVAYYPYTACGDDDCLPYNGYYANYYLPYCSSCNYVSPQYYQPGCNECPATFSSYTLQPGR
jgi:hypothetical protein